MRRLIDDKGKAFGVINIFDLLFITIILGAFIPAAIFQHRYCKDRQSAETENRALTYKYVKAKAYLISDVSERIKKGDRTYDAYGNIAFEVEEIISNEPAIIEIASGQGGAGQKISVGEDSAYQLRFSETKSVMPLGKVIGTPKDQFELRSLRLMEIRLKLLCRMKRNGAIAVLKDDLELIIGKTISFETNGCAVQFTITDVM